MLIVNFIEQLELTFFNTANTINKGYLMLHLH